MANNFGLNRANLFKKYIDALDEVYKLASLTSILDSDSATAKQGANANEIVIPKLSMDGLGDYSRDSGYTGGDVTLTNETVKFNFDRGRAFSVDAMDDEESAGVAFGKLSSEFLRTKVVPEVDAFRFATYAGKSGIGSASGTLADGTAVMGAIQTAVSAMDESEVPQEGRILFITPTLHNAIIALDTTKSRELLAGFTKVVKVPQSRFYTAIEQYDGVTDTSATEGGVNEKVGGYVKASTGTDINFMIIHPSALMQYPKHKVDKIIAPEQNQNADAWKFCYREYGLADAYANKLAGIYCHHKAS